jgi:putative ABC transport system permease protein
MGIVKPRGVKPGPTNWIYSLPLRLRSLLRAGVADADAEEELRDHLDRQTEENVARGMTPEAARRAAQIALGGVEQRKQQMREARGVSWVGDIGRDVQYGLRTMLRRPAFTLAALLMLGLGIGANTAIFSADDAVMFRKLPYRDPSRLVEIFEKNVSDPQEDKMPVSPGNYFDWRAETGAFEDLATWRIASLNLSGEDHPERVRSAEVSANLFGVLGVAPMVGRDFRSGEDAPGRNAVAILSYGLWQRRFGGIPEIVGKTIRANGQVYTVAGVMPPGFRFPIGWLSTDVEVWTPLSWSDAERTSRTDTVLDVLGRLRPDVTVTQAQRRLAVVAQHLADAYPATNREWTVNLMPLSDRGVGDFRALFWLLSIAVALVLLIACANVANLLLARGLERQKELMVRSALGAGRGRLTRQLVTEGVLLSLAGGLLGIGFGYAGVRMLAATAPVSELPELKHAALNLPVLGLALGVAVITGLLFSLVPALTVSGLSMRGSLQETGRANTSTVRGQRLKMALVAGEMALTLALLLCAGDIVNSFWLYMRIDPGFDARDVLTMRIALPLKKYSSAAEEALFLDRVVQAANTIPGIRAAAIGSGAPMEGQGTVMRFHKAGAALAATAVGRSSAEYERVTPDYFHVTGMRLIRGRGVLASDRAGDPSIAVVNETFAKKQFGDADPIGKVLYLDGDVNASAMAKTAGPPLTIVGVIHDTKEYGQFQITPQMIFVPIAQDPEPSVSLLVKTVPGVKDVLPAVRERVARLDAEQPVSNARSLEALVADQHAFFRLNTMLMVSFAAMALLLSVIGIYGVVAYAVSQQRREFGIRLALGSSRGRILSLVLRQAAWMSGVGIAIGLILSWPSTQWLAGTLKASLLLTLKATGPVLYAALSSGMVLAMVLSCLIPAYRATQADPMDTLRGD